MPASDVEEVLYVMRSLVHTKGEWASKPFTILPWQEDWLRALLKRDKAGNRVIQQSLLGVARKGGKSELLAALAIALMLCEREPGGEIIGAAAKRDQAKLILEAGKRMVYWSRIGGRRLSDFIIVRRDGLYFPELDTTWKVISSDGQREHGLNPSVVLMDELHAQGDKRDLWDALVTAQGARANPLMLSISTAGPMRKGLCWDEYVYGRSLASGARNDPNYLFRWYEADPDLEIDDPKAWQQANPGLPRVPKTAFLKRQARDVGSGKLSEYVFRRLHLNQFTNNIERWLPRYKWDACSGQPTFTDNQEVIIGLDAAIRRDSFGISMVGRSPGWAETSDGITLPADVANVRVWKFQPEEGTNDYIDLDDVRTLLLGLANRYRIKKVVFDPAFMTLLAQQLGEAGITCEPFPQSSEKMTKATETFQRLVLEGRLRHGADKTIDEQMSGLGLRESERGVRISKTKSGVIVDCIFAMVMALDAEFGEDIEDDDNFAEVI